MIINVHYDTKDRHFQISVDNTMPLIKFKRAIRELVKSKEKANIYFNMKMLSDEGNIEGTTMCDNSNVYVGNMSNNDLRRKIKISNENLLKAAEIGDVDNLIHLIESDVNINAMDKRGWHAIHLASKHGHSNVVDALLKRGVSVNLKTHSNNNESLHIACNMNRINVVKMLIRNGADIHEVGHLGYTALDCATNSGHLETVKVILEQYETTPSNVYSIMIGLQYGYLDILKEFVRIGMCLDIYIPRGNSAVHLAVEHGQLEVVKYLLELGISMDRKNSEGDTPLHKAALIGNVKIARLLIRSGSDVEAKNDKGETPLHLASKYDRLSVTKYLLNNGANINAIDNYGFTSLDMSSHVRTVIHLMNNKAKTNTRNSIGKTAMKVMRSKDCYDLIDDVSKTLMPIYPSSESNIHSIIPLLPALEFPTSTAI